MLLWKKIYVATAATMATDGDISSNRDHSSTNPSIQDLNFSSTMAQKTMKAIKVLGINDAKIQDVPVPEPQSHEVLVKVSAVAINPIDW